MSVQQVQVVLDLLCPREVRVLLEKLRGFVPRKVQELRLPILPTGRLIAHLDDLCFYEMNAVHGRVVALLLIFIELTKCDCHSLELSGERLYLRPRCRYSRLHRTT